MNPTWNLESGNKYFMQLHLAIITSFRFLSSFQFHSWMQLVRSCSFIQNITTVASSWFIRTSCGKEISMFLVEFPVNFPWLLGTAEFGWISWSGQLIWDHHLFHFYKEVLNSHHPHHVMKIWLFQARLDNEAFVVDWQWRLTMNNDDDNWRWVRHSINTVLSLEL